VELHSYISTALPWVLSTMKRTMGEDHLQAAENVRSLLSAMSCRTLQMKRTIGEDDLQAPENVRSFL